MKKKPFVIPACVAGGLLVLCLGAYGLLSWFGSPLIPGSLERRCAREVSAHGEELAAFARDLARASGAVKELWGCDKINLGSFGDTNPHLHFHIVPKYEGGFEFGGSFAITNPEPVLLSEGEYQEMIAALREKLGL